MGAVYNSYGSVESETGLAPQLWTLGGLGDTRAYSRMAGLVPFGAERGLGYRLDG